MSKILVLLLASFLSAEALAWDDSWKTNNSNSSNSYNEPKSHTLSGSSYNRTDNEYDSRSPAQAERGSYGSYNNSTGKNTQINDNGLIINRE